MNIKFVSFILLILFCICLTFIMSGCKLLDSVRNPENKERGERILKLEEKVKEAVRSGTIDIEEGIATLKEIDDLKKDVAGSDNILYTILGTLFNVGILALRHKLPGIKST